MRFSIVKFVRSFDDYGHPIQVTYKGEESHQTFLGGICTALVQMTTLIMIVLGLENVLLMTDPSITSFSKTITVDEQADTKEISFTKYNFTLAFVIEVESLDGVKSIGLPPEVGRMKSMIEDLADEKRVKPEITHLPCPEVVPGLAKGEVYSNLTCLDKSNSVLSQFSDRKSEGKSIKIELRPCRQW